MKIHILLLSLCATLMAVACHANNELGSAETKMLAAANIESTANNCNVNTQFKEAILKQGFTISNPERIEKVDIANIADNVKAVQRLFNDKENVFNSFTELNRYMLDNNNNKMSGRFYCFQFSTNAKADAWFSVVANAGLKTDREIIFSKPKKLLAKAKNNLYLVEGYRMSNFETLKFIVEQIADLEIVAGPKVTMNP